MSPCKLGWFALLVAMGGDLLVSWLLSLGYPGYSNKAMSISALGNPQSPVRRPFNLWMILEGLLFLSALPAFYGTYHSVSAGLTVAALVLIAIFAVGACMLTGFFSVNASKDLVTTASKIHGAGSAAGFTLFLFVPLLVSLLSFKLHDNIAGGVSIACFLLSLCSFALFVMSDKPGLPKVIVCNEGLWQRLNLLFMYLPLAIIAVKAIAAE